MLEKAMGDYRYKKYNPEEIDSIREVHDEISKQCDSLIGQAVSELKTFLEKIETIGIRRPKKSKAEKLRRKAKDLKSKFGEALKKIFDEQSFD